MVDVLAFVEEVTTVVVALLDVVTAVEVVALLDVMATVEVVALLDVVTTVGVVALLDVVEVVVVTLELVLGVVDVALVLVVVVDALEVVVVVPGRLCDTLFQQHIRRHIRRMKKQDQRLTTASSTGCYRRKCCHPRRP